MNTKITLLSDMALEADRSLAPALEKIASLADVERIVCGVDLHLKALAENPSSIAVATGSLVYPKLTSVAQNCGMTLVNTGMTADRLSTGVLDEFFSLWRRDDLKAFERPSIDLEDLRRMICAGARSEVAVLGTAGSLASVEFGGCIGEPEILPWSELLDVVPRSTLERGLYGFGVVPAGNHFFELQCVEEIADEDECKRRGIKIGDLVAMIHMDGGLVSDDLGNLYANRSATGGIQALVYAARRFSLHMSARSPGKISDRWRLYFSRDPFIAFDPETREGSRAMKAMRFAMNIGYASRKAAVQRLEKTLQTLFPERRTRCEILCDFSHNSIVREEIEGRSFWVHRHNAARVLPGRLVFLPGYAWTSSYICLGEDGARETLFTMDHGAGKTIDLFKARGALRIIDGALPVRSYTSESRMPKLLSLWSDEGLNEVMGILSKKKIARPLARVRPLAGYRFYWKGRLRRFLEKMGGRDSSI